MTVVAGLASVDAVTMLDDLRPLAQIQRWQPDFYIKGGDYSTRGLRSGEAVRAYGGQVATIPVSHAVSSSQIIERVMAVERLAPPAAQAPRRQRNCFSGPGRHAAEGQPLRQRSAGCRINARRG